MAKKAIIAGASGLIGSSLIRILLAQPAHEEILLLVRRELPISHPKLKQLIVDFEQLDKYAASLEGDAIFCCLGSTRKKTPDLKEYRKIDHDYPVKLAEIARQNNIGQYHFVSSIGADATSANFYTKMKGETEADIAKVQLPQIHIYRPSFLTGDRQENRPLEKVLVVAMKVINPLLFGSLKKYRSIASGKVAAAMYKQSLKNTDGIFIYESDQIQQLS